MVGSLMDSQSVVVWVLKEVGEPVRRTGFGGEGEGGVLPFALGFLWVVLGVLEGGEVGEGEKRGVSTISQ